MDSFWLIVASALAGLFLLLWRLEAYTHFRRVGTLRTRNETLQQEYEQTQTDFSQLMAAVQAAEDALLVLSDEFVVLFANPRCQVLFGEAEQGMTLMRYTRSLELEEFVQDALDVELGEVMERTIRSDERIFRVNALRFAGGTALALDDVSEVQRLSRARQDMISNLSHELRTPLSSLRLLADTLQGPPGRNKDVARDLIRKISAEVDLLETITQETLDLAAIESGRQVVRLVPLPLRSLIEQAWGHLGSQAERREITLALEVREDTGVLADQVQAVRAIQNVLHNAIKFSPEGSSIQVRATASEDDAHITLSILDSGEGLHPEELDRIFERFFRGDQSRNTPGTGLGLAIARHIMHAHGGKIWAENRTPPEHGAAFYLTFHTA